MDHVNLCKLTPLPAPLSLAVIQTEHFKEFISCVYVRYFICELVNKVKGMSTNIHYIDYFISLS